MSERARQCDVGDALTSTSTWAGDRNLDSENHSSLSSQKPVQVHLPSGAMLVEMSLHIDLGAFPWG